MFRPITLVLLLATASLSLLACGSMNAEVGFDSNPRAAMSPQTADPDRSDANVSSSASAAGAESPYRAMFDATVGNLLDEGMVSRQESTRPEAPASGSTDGESETSEETGNGGREEAESAVEPDRTPRRIVIYRASLSVVVDSIRDAIQDVAALTESLGGYVSIQRPEMITIRIPAADFHRAITQIGQVGQITEEERTAQDVTDRFVDLRARLTNAVRERDALRELLSRAQTVEEVLMVRERLTQAQELVDRLAGQLQLLADQAALSTISIRFLTVVAPPRQEFRVAGNLNFPWLRTLDPRRLVNFDSY